MGCGNSRQGGAADKKVVKDVSKIDLSTLSRAERFEVSLPITLTDVEVYCKSIKSIHPEKKTLTVAQLMEGMSAIDAWKKVASDSVFMQVLNESPLLKDSDTPSELSKNALLLWGIVLCGGKSAVKVKAFYDVLQDNNQERISAEDKDFPGNFNLMVNLATKLVNTYEPKLSGLEAEHSDELIWKLE